MFRANRLAANFLTLQINILTEDREIETKAFRSFEKESASCHVKFRLADRIRRADISVRPANVGSKIQREALPMLQLLAARH